MSRYTMHVELTPAKIAKIKEQIKPELYSTIPAPGDYRFCYGFDHALYWWYDFSDEDGEVFLEASTIFGNLNHSEFGHILKMVGAPEKHYSAVFMDLAI